MSALLFRIGVQARLLLIQESYLATSLPARTLHDVIRINSESRPSPWITHLILEISSTLVGIGHVSASFICC